jgi:hypothetical protein
MKGIPALRLKGLKRVAVLTGVTGLVLGATLLGTSQAHALTVLGSDPGGVSLSPASGPTSTVPTYSTNEACPTGFQGSGTLYISDPGTSTPASPNLDQLAPTNNSVASPFSGTDNFSIGTELEVFSDLAGNTAEIVVKCSSGPSATGTSEFVMDTFITFNAAGTSYTTSASAPSGPITTTTTLTASPSPAYVGQTVTLTATVAGSPTPTGTVTFESGGTTIGTGPVTLANGVATTTTTFAATGTESLSAVYTPTSGTSFTTSTGTASLTVNAAPANSGIIPLAVTVPPTGSFSLTVDTTDTVNLTVSGANATGATTPIVVSDTRNTYPGWSVSGEDSSWTGSGSAAGGTISGNQLGWVPTDTALGTAVTLGGTVAPASPGLGSTAAVLASATAGLGNGYGTSTLGANLTLAIPATAPAGPYTSGLTITAVTSNP